jgi:peptide/nickel transport system ATP-binding protein
MRSSPGHHFCTEIMAIYRGQIVARGLADDVILRLAHPCTQLLAATAPVARKAGTRVS